jgi:DNA-binding NarL/FixJ family response regulator
MALSLERGVTQPVDALTHREREILSTRRSRQIPGHLGIELARAKNHVHNILKKLHVHRRINASTWYRKGGFHLKLEA